MSANIRWIARMIYSLSSPFNFLPILFLPANWHSPPRNNASPSLPLNAHAIVQRRRTVLLDRNLEADGCGIEFRPLETRIHDFPISANRLASLDSDRNVLLVAQCDLVFHFVQIVRQLLIIQLLALANYIEGVAHVNLKRFVFGGVIDLVFADELDSTF